MREGNSGMKSIQRGPRAWARFKTGGARAWACACLLTWFGACTQEARNPVKAKVFALNPQEYVGAPVELSGKVTAVGPAQSYFVVEDETGKVLVTTERLGDRVRCGKDATARLTGRLSQAKASKSFYLSMEALHECRR